MTGDGAGTDSFARALHDAYRETRLHSPQAVSDVEERLRSKLSSRGLTLTADVLRALAFAIVNDRGT
ncbi:MAG: hypothetical protein M3Y06_00770 [Actinomycetota bacterium]|nr:hypothetical protein [Actinomycetota bacterium]